MKGILSQKVKPLTVQLVSHIADSAKLIFDILKNDLFYKGSANGEFAPSLTPATPYIPIEFDLLMQSNLPAPVKPVVTPRSVTPPVEASSALLVPFTNTMTKQLDVSVNKQSRQDNDVSMLDTGISSTENSLGGNDDVQLLHSPPISSTTSVAPGMAPSLSDVSLKLEEIKPSNIHKLFNFPNESGCFLFFTCFNVFSIFALVFRF